MHNGLDTGAAQGTPIRAAADGTVAMAMTRQGFGNVIVIDHGGRIASLYAHQSAFEVGFGQEVRAGEIIGYVGSTGYSTGPHLHFEVRSFGSPVDPAPYVDHDLEVSCELLIESTHPADEALLDSREDCRVLLTAN
jgi:murein DD-endopeptidase MepM/ murein hydrolase activator NlpD